MSSDASAPRAVGVPTPDNDDSDLEYDLAHEGEAAATAGSEQSVESEPTQVATETPGFHSDYSYDLAHDIPHS